jgi:hypothetical protein
MIERERDRKRERKNKRMRCNLTSICKKNAAIQGDLAGGDTWYLERRQ